MQNIESLIKFHSNIIQFKFQWKYIQVFVLKIKLDIIHSKIDFIYSTMKRDLKTRSNINSCNLSRSKTQISWGKYLILKRLLSNFAAKKRFILQNSPKEKNK
jgi:hypothetical protein